MTGDPADAVRRFIVVYVVRDGRILCARSGVAA